MQGEPDGMSENPPLPPVSGHDDKGGTGPRSGEQGSDGHGQGPRGNVRRVAQARQQVS